MRPDGLQVPQIGIDVVEPGQGARNGRTPLYLWRDIKFSTAGLESYAFANWQPVLHDAMVLAAAVEFGDKIAKRPGTGWARQFTIQIPVHDPTRWSAPAVVNTLQDAIEFLTGDKWEFEFIQLSQKAPSPQQKYLFTLQEKTKAVLPYSDGMDSRAVAGIVGTSLGEGLVRVRIGSKKWDWLPDTKRKKPFTSVPYKLSCNNQNKEPSARTRGFKFTLISCVAACLTNADVIVVPESGQGAIGPALLHLGHIYPDYRNHPAFGQKMAKFVNSLLGTQIQFEYPRIWYTKGETLREYVSGFQGDDWATTRSCWRGNNWASIDGKLRQCGICAACMLRRVSVHAAGLMEEIDTYIVADMNARSLDSAIDQGFTRASPIFHDYAIAGVLHMDHMADLAKPDAFPIVRRHAILLSNALNIAREDAENQLIRLFQKHADEWLNYLASLEAHSFLKQWVQGNDY